MYKTYLHSVLIHTDLMLGSNAHGSTQYPPSPKLLTPCFQMFSMFSAPSYKPRPHCQGSVKGCHICDKYQAPYCLSFQSVWFYIDLQCGKVIVLHFTDGRLFIIFLTHLVPCLYDVTTFKPSISGATLW